jgi:hypothetical protein
MINALALVDSMHARRRELEINYRNIVVRCRRLLQCAADRGMYSCLFEVPEFILGVPCYRIRDCLRYMCDILNAAGYRVIYCQPRTLWIGWGTTSQESGIADSPLSISSSSRPLLPVPQDHRHLLLLQPQPERPVLRRSAQLPASHHHHAAMPAAAAPHSMQQFHPSMVEQPQVPPDRYAPTRPLPWTIARHHPSVRTKASGKLSVDIT